MKTIEITVPEEIINLVGSEETAQKEAKVAFILDLVRRGKISKSKAAELMGISLWDLPALLAQYDLPWFRYGPEDLERDLALLHKHENEPGERD
jgi:predicted HTH domain antitoxin